MKLLLVIEYSTIEELQAQLNHNVINDWGSRLLDMVEQCKPGVLWDDQGVFIAAIADSVEVSLAPQPTTEPVFELVEVVTGAEIRALED